MSQSFVFFSESAADATGARMKSNDAVNTVALAAVRILVMDETLPFLVGEPAIFPARVTNGRSCSPLERSLMNRRRGNTPRRHVTP
jgi:hypothetical protein